MRGNEKIRADQYLVQQGLAQSREKAQAMIMAGMVYQDQQKITKPSFQVKAGTELTVRGEKSRYVSRGALKLEKGLRVFGVSAEGRTAMDVGASTGGFTDVLLQNGAKQVFAIDVGYGQLDWKLRNDPRVLVMERVNARFLKREDLPAVPSLAVMDVSFISITKILPVLAEILDEDGEIITLIKPQFEAGREKVGKKGVVREAAVHEEVISNILSFVQREMGWFAKALSYSPIRGPEGNIEFLLHIISKENGTGVEAGRVKDVVKEAHQALSGEETGTVL